LPSENNLSYESINKFIEETSEESAVSDASPAFAVVLPLDYHAECAMACAKKILCGVITGEEPCPAWTEKGHPDLIVSGKPDEAATIEFCRTLWNELSLKPVASACRMGVLYSANRMSLPAVNSLLKITEEPPRSGRIMLLLEENSMLPTLRSRIRVFNYIADRAGSAESPDIPKSLGPFLKWIGRTRKMSPREMLPELENWAMFFAGEKDFGRASSLDSICMLARKGKLTTPMIQDLVWAGLEGEVRFEQLLDNFW